MQVSGQFSELRHPYVQEHDALVQYHVQEKHVADAAAMLSIVSLSCQDRCSFRVLRSYIRCHGF